MRARNAVLVMLRFSASLSHPAGPRVERLGLPASRPRASEPRSSQSGLVAPPGLEPGFHCWRGILSRTVADLTDHEREIGARSDTRSDAELPERPPQAARVVSEIDPVELALANALERASAAG